MIQLIELYRVVGRRLTQKLIEARWIVHVRSGPGGILFDAEKVHRALGRLVREGYTLLPRSPFSRAEREAARRDAPSLEEIVLDEAELARLSD